ncbi:putative RNA polymerase sigma factor FecI [compost metagenome]
MAPSPEAVALGVEMLMRVDAVLHGLPPAVRAVFLYSQLDGLGYDEIGRRMGLSVRTVQRHMALALERCLRVRREGFA